MLLKGRLKVFSDIELFLQLEFFIDIENMEELMIDFSFVIQEYM